MPHLVKPFGLGLIAVLMWVCAGTVHAQARPKAGLKDAGSAPPAGACVIAEFRHIAFTVHDPQDRLDQAIAWLKKNGDRCSPTQMVLINSNKATWMGTSDSMALSTVTDALMEKRMGQDHEAVMRYYKPDVQAPKRASEGATNSAGAGGAKPAAANGGAPTSVPMPMPMPGSADGLAVALAPMVLPETGPSAPTQNININLGGPKLPAEDLSRKLPLPSEPLFGFAPELGAPLLNYFGKIRRQMTRTFFMESLSPGKCPEGMRWQTDSCGAITPVAWRFGEKIPRGSKTFPIEPKLLEKLNFDPGYTFVRIGGDILALERDTGKIADAVINLGKAA